MVEHGQFFPDLKAYNTFWRKKSTAKVGERENALEGQISINSRCRNMRKELRNIWQASKSNKHKIMHYLNNVCQ